jgi:transcriptional regulator with XRE-family HTH domain
MTAPPDSDQVVCENVRRARLMSQLTQGELASHLGVARTHVTRWENGARIPNRATVDRIAAELDLPSFFFYVDWHRNGR